MLITLKVLGKCLHAQFFSTGTLLLHKVTCPYETLGVEQSASQSQIKASYYRLSKEFHPDRNGTHQAAVKFLAVVEAYEMLGSTEKRAAYDRSFLRGRPPQPREDFEIRRPGSRSALEREMHQRWREEQILRRRQPPPEDTRSPFKSDEDPNFQRFMRWFDRRFPKDFGGGLSPGARPRWQRHLLRHVHRIALSLLLLLWLLGFFADNRMVHDTVLPVTRTVDVKKNLKPEVMEVVTDAR